MLPLSDPFYCQFFIELPRDERFEDQRPQKDLESLVETIFVSGFDKPKNQRAANCSAICAAAIMLAASALPVPAISSAVP